LPGQPPGGVRLLALPKKQNSATFQPFVSGATLGAAARISSAAMQVAAEKRLSNAAAASMRSLQ